MSDLIDAYVELTSLPCAPKISWDEFMVMLDALGCIWNLDKEAIAEWLLDNIYSEEYSINCQKEIKPHGSIVFIP